jgi:pimeloyl-ACP methyl ester carboxylesterase
MVRPISVQGLNGRMLLHPDRNKSQRTIVFIYGIHGSLERFYGVIHYLARFGRVAVPDLPGMGGMESFYRTNRVPTLDAYGDYLADFIAQELPEGRLALVGLSFGFVVITRMLVRHPELSSRVDLVISTMGLADGRDINLKGLTRLVANTLFWIARTPPLGQIFQYIVTRPWVLRLTYTGQNPKMKVIKLADRPSFIAFEAYLWKCNDMRTYGQAMTELFALRQPGAHVALTVHHIATQKDHWLDVAAAEKHIGAIYDSLVLHPSNLTNHGGTAYADEDEAREIIPETVTNLLQTTT